MMAQLGQYLDDRIPDLVTFGLKVLVSLIVLYVGIRLIHVVLRIFGRSMERAGADKGVIQFISSLLKALLYFFLIFIIAVNFGVKESSAAALLGTLGVTVGLALQGGLSNLAGGVIILLFKPFQVGDYLVLENGSYEGTVFKIDIFYTTMVTRDNKHVVIPNGTISNDTIVNATAREQCLVDLRVGISYESDIRTAKAVLEQVLTADADVLSEKGLEIFVDELGDSAVVLGFRAWVPTTLYWPVRWRLLEQIKEEFDRAGVVIPYNQLDVHLEGRS